MRRIKIRIVTKKIHDSFIFALDFNNQINRDNNQLGALNQIIEFSVLILLFFQYMCPISFEYPTLLLDQ